MIKEILMRPRSARVRFEDFFSPADFAHVNWVGSNARSLLAGRRVDVDVDPDVCRHCAGNDCRACSQDVEGAFAPRRVPDSGSTGQEARDGHYAPAPMAEWIAERAAAPSARRHAIAYDEAFDENTLVAELRRVSALSRGAPSGVSGSGDRQREDHNDRWATREAPLGSQGSPRTLEYDPVRDQPVARELIQFQDGKILFKPLRRSMIEDGHGNQYPAEAGVIKADNGVLIEATRNTSGQRNLDTNCHGQTFARGRVVIDPNQVDKILANDRYCELRDRRRVQPGDVVIYRRDGYPVHSARVVAIENGTIIVEGKIGQQPGLLRSSYDRQWPPPAAPDDEATPVFYSQRGCPPR